MKRALRIILCLTVLAGIFWICGFVTRRNVMRAQSTTFLELELRWSDGSSVSNATTIFTEPNGTVTATGATPHISLPLNAAIYTIQVQAPATSTHKLLNYAFSVPLATTIPTAGTIFTVTKEVVSVTFNTADPRNGSLTVNLASSFAGQ